MTSPFKSNTIIIPSTNKPEGSGLAFNIAKATGQKAVVWLPISHKAMVWPPMAKAIAKAK